MCLFNFQLFQKQCKPNFCEVLLVVEMWKTSSQLLFNESVNELLCCDCHVFLKITFFYFIKHKRNYLKAPRLCHACVNFNI